MWTTVHRDDLEADFIEHPELPKVWPAGHTIIYNRAKARAEMDAKIVPQREVYPDGGRQSAVGFLPYASFQWWAYTDPVSVAAGQRTRASAALMVVSHGIDGDNTRAGDCGMRVGLATADVLDPLSEAIVWCPNWQTVRGTVANEYEWKVLYVPEFVPAVGRVRLWIQCDANWPVAINAGHWDAERIEQYIEPGAGVTEERVIELIRQYAPGVIAERLG